MDTITTIATTTITAAKPLRQWMQQGMMMRGLLPRTQEQYVRHVRRFAGFLGRSPDTATPEDLRRFQVHQHEKGASAATINGAVSALRFLYTVTLRQRELGGIASGGDRWIGSRPAFLLPVRVLGALFRRLYLTRLMGLHASGRLGFFGGMAHLADRRAFLRYLSPVRKKRWVVYAKPPFAGPEAVLAYLSRHTHRIAISNRRLIAFDQDTVTLRYKDYRRDGPERQRVMTLSTTEFIRRFLLHVLPKGFHRIRHYGLLAASPRKTSLALARQLLKVAPPPPGDEPVEPVDTRPPCPCCGGHMVVIEAFER